MSRPVAIVTAAGSGMGAEIARTLAGAGFAVGVLSSSGKGEALAHEIGGFGFTGSNRDPAALAAFVGALVDAYGRLDAVVNSAGHGPKGDLLELTDAEWHEAADVYLLNVIRIARLAVPELVKSGGGAIVNISTFAAFEPDPAFPTSSVMRAGLASFCKLLADRHAADGIRVNNVLPGFIDSLPEREDFRARIPMGRYGTTREVAELVRFLVGDGGTYITGQNIRVDGGITRSV